MPDKRSTQMSLPLGLDAKEPEFKDHVTQHWNVTFARQKKVSVFAKRIMALVLSQIKADALKLLPYYQIHISKIVTEAGISEDLAYKEVRKAIDQLTDLKWSFEELNSRNKKYVPRHLLDTTKTIANDGFESGYNNGLITIILNPALEPYFLQLAHYTTYEIKHYMHFKSWYSMRMFELLSAFQDTGVWWVKIDEFRELMDCKDKYPEVKNLIDRTLSEPLEELKETKFAFNYEPLIDENKVGRGRKPIIGIQFNFTKVKPKTYPKTWLQYSDEYKRVLLGLAQFKVTDRNIAMYAKTIGFDKARKLLREWQIKEISNERINDRERYCNAVWVRVGKECLAREATKLYI